MRKKWYSGLIALFGFLLLGFGQLQTVHAETATITQTPSSESGMMYHTHQGSTGFEQYMIIRKDGKAVFCVDPWTAVVDGTYTSEAMEEQVNIGRDVTINKEILRKLELIAYFGYYTYQTDARYTYTQGYIWETLNFVPTQFTGTLSMSGYNAFKAEVQHAIDNYKNTPSWNEESHVLKVGESIVLTDTYNVIQQLNVPTSQNGYTLAVNGNQLTITATKDSQDGELGFVGTMNEYYGQSLIWKKPGSQTIGELRIKDPLRGFVELTTVKNGKIQVVKKDTLTSQVLSGIEFGLFEDGKTEPVQLATTNENGIAVFEDVEIDRPFYIKETRSKQGYILNKQRYDVTVQAGEEKEIVVTNDPVPTIETEATTQLGNKVGYEYEQHVEVATMNNLIVGKEYRVVASQYNKNGNVLSTQEATFTATQSTEKMRFVFKVPTGYRGKIVYGEDLYTDDEKVAFHFDLSNEKQTVEVIEPGIETEATTQSGNKVGYEYEQHVEVATMNNLIVGKEYRVVATQYDKDGNVLDSQEASFTATQTTENMRFVFKVPTGYRGKIVYGEDLYTENEKVAFHFDLSNEKQTVEVIEPNIETEATTQSGNKVGYEYEQHVEVATMGNLIVGKEYRVVAKQYDKDGNVLDSQEATFTATQTTEKMRFVFKVPTGYRGKIVYGEDLYTEDEKVAFHFDLSNEKQTVTVLNPVISTTALVNQQKTVVLGEHAVLTDTIRYEDFKDEEVFIRTWLVKYGTDEVVGEVFEQIVRLNGNGEYVIESSSIDVSSLEIGKYTMMEQIYEVNEDGTVGRLISEHTDNKDESQTIEVLAPVLPSTGSTLNAVLVVLGFVFALMGVLVWKKEKNEHV